MRGLEAAISLGMLRPVVGAAPASSGTGLSEQPIEID